MKLSDIPVNDNTCQTALVLPDDPTVTPFWVDKSCCYMSLQAWIHILMSINMLEGIILSHSWPDEFDLPLVVGFNLPCMIKTVVMDMDDCEIYPANDRYLLPFSA